MNVEATVIIPTHDHGPTLRASVGSALQQSIPVEVFVIGDGVPEETRALVQEMAHEDGRVHFLDHPKGPRHGEIYRHQALAQASGRVVCYLADDDVYLPHHVEDMCRLLEDADFAHAQAVEVLLDGGIAPWTVDLALPAYQRDVLRGINRIPLSAGAHTLSAYRSLVDGWTSAPHGIPTDLYMWQKFVRHPGCRFLSGWRPSVLVFPSPKRPHLSGDERLREMQLWMTGTAGEQDIARLNQQVLAAKTVGLADLEARFIDAIHAGGKLQLDFVFQVFFPSPGGHNEQDSARFPVRTGVWQKIIVRFPCPASGLSIRIDPSNEPCLIELGRINVRGSDGGMLWQLTKDNSHDLHIEGSAAEISMGHVLVVLSAGNDPQVVLPPLLLPREPDNVELEVLVRLDADVQRLAGLFSDHLRLCYLERGGEMEWP